jgi:hypothetical protein
MPRACCAVSRARPGRAYFPGPHASRADRQAPNWYDARGCHVETTTRSTRGGLLSILGAANKVIQASAHRRTMKHRFCAWLAIVALLANAPWLLQVHATSGASDLPLDLCTAATPHKASGAIDDTAPGVPPVDHSAGQHCAGCGASVSEWMAVHSGTDALAFRVPQHRPSPPPSISPRVESLSYLPARPRGPPAVS